MTGSTCTIEQAAAMDFQPMTLEPNQVISPAAFREQAMSVYAVMVIATRLLNLSPADLARVLIDADPDDPGSAVEQIHTAAAWLEGFASVLGCAEARAVIALAKWAKEQ